MDWPLSTLFKHFKNLANSMNSFYTQLIQLSLDWKYPLSELNRPFPSPVNASVSKRVKVRNHSYENDFELQKKMKLHAKLIFIWKGSYIYVNQWDIGLQKYMSCNDSFYCVRQLARRTFRPINVSLRKRASRCATCINHRPSPLDKLVRVSRITPIMDT